MSKHASSRRAILGSGASLLLLTAAAAGAAKAAELDGELLRLCAEFHASQARIDAMQVDSGARLDAHPDEGMTDWWRSWEAKFNAQNNAWCDLFDQIALIQPRTPEGLRAKAAVLEQDLLISEPDGEFEDQTKAFAYALVRDIMGRAAA